MDSDQAKERKILESFVVNNKNLDTLESKVSRFNIFEAVGMVRQEIKHSHFIKFLLDPSEKHQLKDLFIKKLLTNILSHSQDAPLDVLDVSVWDFNDSKVSREWKYIDLLIYSPSNNFVCTIENKVDASLHDRQLEDYSELIYKEFPQCKKIFVYLTKDGDNAHEVIIDLNKNGDSFKVNWLSLSYETIADIIETLCDDYRSHISEAIYLSMCHYVDLVRRHIVSESDIAKLCRKIYRQHSQAIDLIYEHRPDVQLELAEYVGKIIAGEEKVVDDCGGKTSISFAPIEWNQLVFQNNSINRRNSQNINSRDLSGDRINNQNSNSRNLLFAFSNAPRNLDMALVICPTGEKTRERIYKTIQDLYISGFKKCNNITKENSFSVPYRVPILNPADYDEENLEYLEKKIDEFWIKFMGGDLAIIRKAVYDSFEKISENTKPVEPSEIICLTSSEYQLTTNSQ